MSEMNEATIEVCEACRLVPIAHLSLDLDTPMGGWAQYLEKQGIDVMVDDCGRQSVSRVVFRQLVLEQTSRRKLAAERAALRTAEARTTRKRYSGVPAREGMSAYESMIASDGRIVTPAMEFGGGRERPRFLEETLDANAQAIVDRRARRAAKKERR